MALTPGQKKCVDTLVGPVAVSAGAGSGKTFTLTRRIVHSLECGFVSGIDEVLAITFTSKAAGEIKSRVKGALKACGRSDQALLVDSAWISTIHGACARMLRAHALDLGIAPDFTVADEAAASDMLDAALEEVLGSENDIISPGDYDALFTEYAARQVGSVSAASVEGMVRDIVIAAQSSPEGMASIVPAPSAASPCKLLARMASLAGDITAVCEAQKPGKTRDAFLDGTARALEGLEAAQQQGEEPSPEQVLELFNAFPVPSRAFGTSEYKELAAEAAQGYLSLMMEARLALAEPRMREVIDLSGRVFDAYRRRKHEAGMLDNDDLLTMASRMFSEHPEIAAEYADRFKLIMVDEFQDTDQLQVNMVKRMAGKNFERLCTVGDAQQSIYRFRGADVSVYNRHLASVANTNEAGLIELADNFRSHVDVLAFVDCVFSQPSVFGRSFMSLSASRDSGRIDCPYQGFDPRIEVQLTTYPRGVASDTARAAVAQRIAQRFAKLVDEGHSAGDMVVLLGSMRCADVYADAIREQGLSCVVSGGSIFGRAPEVRLAVRLAEVIANPKDTEALFEVLSSEIFALTADDFIDLSTGLDELRGIPRRRSLDSGVSVCAAAENDASLIPGLRAAVRTLKKAAFRVRLEPLSKVMEGVLLDSGWLRRLEDEGAEGLARAANVYKACRLARDIERRKGSGPAQTAVELRAHIEIAKEAPGSLSSKSGDFVRIMTVHASKGLEFPIVAVAELRSDEVRSSRMVRTTLNGKTYLSLDAGATATRLTAKQSQLIAKCTSVDPFEGDEDDEFYQQLIEHPGDHSPVEVRCAIRQHEHLGETEETRRLLYVALTRAQEAVICAIAGKTTKDDPTGLAKSVWGSVESALCGEGNAFEPGVTLLDFGGESPARVERIDLTVESEEPYDSEVAGAEAANQEEGCSLAGVSDPARRTVEIPEVLPHCELLAQAWPASRADVFSYSSIAHSPSDEAGTSSSAEEIISSKVPPVEEPGFSEVDEAAWTAIRASLSGDADKATDLGTAFHRLAQQAVCTHAESAALVCPDKSHVDALARHCGLSDLQRIRLTEALARWFESDLAARVATFSRLRAEVPFFVRVGRGASAPFMEGEIDLLADGEDGRTALVVDYKTGGSPGETPTQLHEKHRLQALCYAYALLMQGYESTEFAFVRVEQPDDTKEGQPQQVNYTFTAADLPAIEGEILARYASSFSA
ncbi:UvrD-helicase domain-containing protein [uncultured Ellagibacter sp.]|uniref:UvrD-helicase domain-containing protein n=1 Tax=uncultured Ellagibacter sp. TaxID=2137580 RepID=UPI00260DA63E|nr:UvrD-helicase domain-containing protein [uncultured Ellagibacter sp.]